MPFLWDPKIENGSGFVFDSGSTSGLDENSGVNFATSDECGAYFSVYSPLCPSPKSEDRDAMIAKTFERFVYLDNNATHPILPEVKEEMVKMMDVIGNASSSHDAGVKVRAFIERARINIAKKIGLVQEEDARRIIFTSSGTESINTFIKGTVFRNISSFGKFKDSEKNVIITTRTEHKATLKTVEWLSEKIGIEPIYLECDANGLPIISWSDLEQIKDRILLVTMMAANNETGTILPVHEYCDRFKKMSSAILFHSDMSQTVGKMKNVAVGNLDAATFTAHKFGGPIGVSVLYAKNFDLFDPLLHGGNQEFQKRAGTYNPIQIVGMSKAIELISDEKIDVIGNLRDYLEEKLSDNFECRMNCRLADRLKNTSSVTFFYQFIADDLINYLSSKGIFVSASSACNSREKSPSFVLKAIGMSDEDAYRTIRITFNRINTKEDIDFLAEELGNFFKNSVSGRESAT